MASLAQNAGSFGAGDPNAILNECRSIDRGIDQIEQNLNQLRMLQDRSLNEADTSGSSTSRQLDSLASETMDMYRQLTERVRQVKSQREAQQPKNAPQVGRVDRRLKQAIQSFQQVESAFRKKTQDQMARQYRIVRPEASESEVRSVVEDTSSGSQVFQQAMMQSDRRGQARAVLSAVQDRHAALMKIEQQMVELAQLFQDMDTLVVQQEVQVTQIEQKGEEVVENLDKGNEEIAVAVTTAKKTRKKKWICLGICGMFLSCSPPWPTSAACLSLTCLILVAIVLVIVLAVVIYIEITKAAKPPPTTTSSSKRSVHARAVDLIGEAPVVANVQPRYVIAGPAFQNDGQPQPPVARFAAIAAAASEQSADTAKRFVVVDGVTPSVGKQARRAALRAFSEKRYVLGTDFTTPDGTPLSDN